MMAILQMEMGARLHVKLKQVLHVKVAVHTQETLAMKYVEMV